MWDSTAELRYLVLPERPAGTEELDIEALAALVSRNSMIGTDRDLSPADEGGRLMDGIHDLGGKQGYGPIESANRRNRFTHRGKAACGRSRAIAAH